MRHWSRVLPFILLIVAGCTSAPPIQTSPPPTPASTTLSGAPTLIPYTGNPVLANGESGAWDSEAVFNGRVVYHQDRYHLFYNGRAGVQAGDVAIGYAVSDDGKAFTRMSEGPILAGDERGFDALQVSDGTPLVTEDQWILYYSAGVAAGPGKAIGRAVGSSPEGPWRRGDAPVLVVGLEGAWDAGFVSPQSVIHDGEEYVMYYMGGSGMPGTPALVGRATSPDATTWVKYNDPATTEAPFAESDPVLQVGAPGSWDTPSIWGCTVLKTATGWEMFYAAGDGELVQIGYATSDDGIHWTKDENNPLLTPENDLEASTNEPPILESPSVVLQDTNYYLYYDYGVFSGGIGLALGEPTTP